MPRRYLIVVPRPKPTAPRRYLIVVPITMRAAPLVVRRRYLIVVPRPLPAVALVVRRRAVFICRDAQAAARDGARCASQVLDRCARPLPAAPRRLLSVVPRPLPAAALDVRRRYLTAVSSQVNTLPIAKSQTRSKQNKDMHKFGSVYSERRVPLPVLTSGGE